MTVGIVVACKDGVVVGADRKVTRSRGTRIKSLEDKIVKLKFRDGRNLLVCSAGGADFAKRGIEAIEPSELDTAYDCSTYRDLVEGRISRLRSRLSERGLDYDATLLFGIVDIGGKPVIGHITPLGLTELRSEGYFTAGIAAPYAEMVLKDSYSPAVSVQDAKLIVGGLIEKIGEVDNDVEGMDVFSISVEEKAIEELNWSDRQALKWRPLSLNLGEKLEAIKRESKSWAERLARVRTRQAKTTRQKESKQGTN